MRANKSIKVKDITIDKLMYLKDARVLVILNGRYGKLYELSNPLIATPITSAYNAQPLLQDFMVMTRDEVNIRQ